VKEIALTQGKVTMVDDETEQGEPQSYEDDGCPKENVVLRKEWRKLTAENKRLAGVICPMQYAPSTVRLRLPPTTIIGVAG